MSTPIETAGLAFAAHGVPASVAEAAARDAFASLTQHRDDIAREFERHELDVRTFRGGEYRDTFCYACWTTFPRGADSGKHQTDAVLAYLTGEAG